ncbi:MAG: hypothetical protein U1G05_16295 [Kiritimatiellia bacterium]
MNPPSPSPPPPATGSVPRRRFRLLVLLPAVAVAGLGLATLAGYFPPLHRTVPPAEEYQVRALQRLRERVRAWSCMNGSATRKTPASGKPPGKPPHTA